MEIVLHSSEHVYENDFMFLHLFYPWHSPSSWVPDLYPTNPTTFVTYLRPTETRHV